MNSAHRWTWNLQSLRIQVFALCIKNLWSDDVSFNMWWETKAMSSALYCCVCFSNSEFLNFFVSWIWRCTMYNVKWQFTFMANTIFVAFLFVVCCCCRSDFCLIWYSLEVSTFEPVSSNTRNWRMRFVKLKMSAHENKNVLEKMWHS